MYCLWGGYRRPHDHHAGGAAHRGHHIAHRCTVLRVPADQGGGGNTEPDVTKVTVKVCGISFGYNGKNTLNDINIECKCGEFIGLIGPNGSGKTTLLRCINGVLKPKMGTILVDGKNIDKMKIKEIAKVCANVPTDAAEDLALTVHEFVFLGRYPL